MHLVPLFFNFAVIFPQDVQQGFDAYFQLKSLTGLAEEETRLYHVKYHVQNYCTKITTHSPPSSEHTNIESTI